MPTATQPLFRIARADWRNDRRALRQIRELVFLAELGHAPELEWDQSDSNARHLLASNPEAGAPIGAIRRMPSGKIERLAVLPQWRQRGIGSALIAAAVREIGLESRVIPWLETDQRLVAFFRNLGFQEVGFAGESQSPRRMQLTNPDALMVADLHSRVLGETSGRLVVTQAAHLALAASALASQTRRCLDLLTIDLQPALYDQDRFIEAARNLVLERHGRLPVRILVTYPESAIRRGHRLIELTRRLSSDAQIRTPPADWSPQSDQFLLCDQQGHCLTRYRDPRQTLVDFNNSAETRRLRRLFDQLWERSDSHPGLRRLYL